jgi:hypothetical protein
VVGFVFGFATGKSSAIICWHLPTHSLQMNILDGPAINLRTLSCGFPQKEHEYASPFVVVPSPFV